MKNIVLTGMSGVGKTKIGTCLSEKTKWKLVDIDELIVQEEKMSIEEIFKSKGEEYFRVVETEMIDRVSSLENQIISTGGGAILREINMFKLRNNGYIILLMGKIQTIVDNLNKSKIVRPLLNNKINLYEDVKKLYSSRINLYRSTADMIIDVDNKDLSGVCDEILKKYNSL